MNTKPRKTLSICLFAISLAFTNASIAQNSNKSSSVIYDKDYKYTYEYFEERFSDRRQNYALVPLATVIPDINKYDENKILKNFSSFKNIYTKETVIDDWVVFFPDSHDIKKSIDLVRINKVVFKKYLLLDPERAKSEISLHAHSASTFVINHFATKNCGFYVDNIKSKYTMTFSTKGKAKILDVCRAYPTLLGISSIELNYEISNFTLNGNL